MENAPFQLIPCDCPVTDLIPVEVDGLEIKDKDAAREESPHHIPTMVNGLTFWHPVATPEYHHLALHRFSAQLVPDSMVICKAPLWPVQW